VISKSLLKSLNLSPAQAAVYIAALELGQATIQGLSKKSGVPRASIYTFINELRERQLMTETKKGKRNLYGATEPSRLVDIEQTRLHELKSVIPELAAIANKARMKPRVTFYEGIDGLKQIYPDVLTAQTEVVGFADFNTGPGVMGERYYTEYLMPARVKKGILFRVIVRDTPEARKFAAERDNRDLRETKFLPGDNVPTELNIYNNKIVMFSFNRTKPFAVMIEDDALARTQRLLWLAAWDRLPG
jgi:HTH-type transcriptional regulator, sugar sensing transcriptional regulator